MNSLPPFDAMIKRCRALAALDLILSPIWQYRHYSFDGHWSDHEVMASMRDGSGDAWWAVFHDDGWAALKGLGHESSAWSEHGETLSRALQKAIPKEMASFATEDSFEWEATSFAFYLPKGAAQWTRANDATKFAAETDTGEDELLAHVIGTPAEYAKFATDLYELELTPQMAAHIFALKPISATTVTRINPETSLEEIEEELYEQIGYPRE